MAITGSIIEANGVDLCVETMGDRNDPPILLIHGAAASMLGWPDDFCRALVAGSRFVIRYDHRDTGQSTSYPPGKPPYSGRDLVNDAVGILEALEIDHAHIVGISMGGGIAQVLGTEHPDRVSSLTLMATTAGGPDLPPPSTEFLDFVRADVDINWSDHNAVVERVLGMFRVCSGGSGRLDEAEVRQMLQRDLARSTADPQSCQINHFLINPGEPVRHRLGEIGVPTLIMHGALDPVFPVPHAYALANAIPGATICVLPNVGHVIVWEAPDTAASAVLEHTGERTS